MRICTGNFPFGKYLFGIAHCITLTRGSSDLVPMEISYIFYMLLRKNLMNYFIPIFRTIPIFHTIIANLHHSAKKENYQIIAYCDPALVTVDQAQNPINLHPIHLIENEFFDE